MPEVPDEPELPEVPNEPFIPEVPEEELEPEVPDVPEEPSPPEAPSRFTVQEEYVPDPTVRVGAKNTSSPVPELYVLTSHSWKLLASNTIIID